MVVGMVDSVGNGTVAERDTSLGLKLILKIIIINIGDQGHHTIMSINPSPTLILYSQ